jgi:riboflavin kinase/FMN adenylyltransferase
MRLVGPDEVLGGRSVVTVGTFDGVHRGHQALLEAARRLAADLRILFVVVTFDPPPARVLKGDAAPGCLTPLSEKLMWLDRWGVPAVAVIPFTEELSRLPGDDFLDRELTRRLGAAAVVEGTTFSYGAGGVGNVDTLRAWGDDRGVAVRIIPPVDLAPLAPMVSSSRVREAVGAGNLALAASALGRPYSAYGTVVPGDGRGRTIGVPTANVSVPPEKVMPPVGVYAGWAWSDDARWPAVANFGYRPTFGGTGARLEVHLLEGSPDLYGRALGMSLAARLRAEQTFSSVDALVRQIRADQEQARRLFHDGTIPDPFYSGQ